MSVYIAFFYFTSVNTLKMQERLAKSHYIMRFFHLRIIPYTTLNLRQPSFSFENNTLNHVEATATFVFSTNQEKPLSPDFH